MKGLILSTILSSLLSHGANTSHPVKSVAVPLPEKCPSIAVIASQGLDHVSPFILAGFNSWMGIKENTRYDTNDNWTFMGLQINGDRNGKVAIQQITSQLNSLHINGEPQIDSDSQIAFCLYTQDDSLKQDNPYVVGIAYTPSSYS
jgi:hypothetical protein